MNRPPLEFVASYSDGVSKQYTFTSPGEVLAFLGGRAWSLPDVWVLDNINLRIHAVSYRQLRQLDEFWS